MKYASMAKGGMKKTKTVKVNPLLLKKNIHEKSLGKYKFGHLNKNGTMRDGQREPRMNDSEPGGLLVSMKHEAKRTVKKKMGTGKKLHQKKTSHKVKVKTESKKKK